MKLSMRIILMYLCLIKSAIFNKRFVTIIGHLQKDTFCFIVLFMLHICMQGRGKGRKSGGRICSSNSTPLKKKVLPLFLPKSGRAIAPSPQFLRPYQATANSERWHYFDANTPPGKGAFLACRIISFQSHNAPHIELDF